MAVTFVASGTLASNTDQNRTITAPACNADDILICALYYQSSDACTISAPDGTWTEVIAQGLNDTNIVARDIKYALFWKRATASGGDFVFSKSVADAYPFGGVILAYRGAETTGSPVDATAPTAKNTSVATQNVSFNAFNPTSTDVRVIFVAYYSDNVTTFAAAMSNDTNPDCTIDTDQETSIGSDFTIAVTSGTNNGDNVAARTWDSGQTTGGATGIVFALVAEAGGGETVQPNHLRSLMGCGN